MKRVSAEWFQNDLVWLEYVSGRTLEEELQATLNIALVDRRDNMFECSIWVGETRDFARNHLLDALG